MTDCDKVIIAAIVLMIALCASGIGFYVYYEHKHKNCVCVEKRMIYNGIWSYRCVKYEHHHELNY